MPKALKVKIKLDKKAKIPEYKTIGAACFDLVYVGDKKVLRETKAKLFSTGLYVEIPEGYELQIRTRSSLGREGVVVANSPGTIDSDYRGEVMVLLKNLSGMPIIISPGDRIAQAALKEVVQAEFEQVKELSETARGSGGFGSTGRN